MSIDRTGIDAAAWAGDFFTKWGLADLFAIQYASRAQSGFQFLVDILNPDYFLHQEATSAPVSRQMHLLISYNFELLLDAAVCASSSKETEAELDKEVSVNHQLGSLWGKVTKTDVRKVLDIKRIKPPRENDTFENFEIYLNSGEVIVIPEFRNIRYDVTDFRGRENASLRSAVTEKEAMKFAIHTFADASKKMTSYLYSKYPR
jgi:hypothetical protein